MKADLIKKAVRSLSDRDVTRCDFTSYTHARAGLGHTGGHWRTQDWLRFQADCALAKDAVASCYPLLEMRQLCERLALPSLEVQSNAPDLQSFLLCPSAGRQLSSTDKMLLSESRHGMDNPDLMIVVSGGLSSIAIRRQASDFLRLLVEGVQQESWTLAPVILNQRGRVALGDQINFFIRAKMVVMLIGERPGLSSPDSMGVYFTYDARPGCTDAQRNCISNIHEQGLQASVAVDKLIYMLKKAFVQQITGVHLKDDFIISS